MTQGHFQITDNKMDWAIAGQTMAGENAFFQVTQQDGTIAYTPEVPMLTIPSLPVTIPEPTAAQAFICSATHYLNLFFKAEALPVFILNLPYLVN